MKERRQVDWQTLDQCDQCETNASNEGGPQRVKSLDIEVPTWQHSGCVRGDAISAENVSLSSSLTVRRTKIEGAFSAESALPERTFDSVIYFHALKRIAFSLGKNSHAKVRPSWKLRRCVYKF
ncbi:PREDICTED: uncharacterized protein LOC105559123 [Vollenhovia emeryi]|uniref:uncharacterized protein LOC105559123 n=1 Tax=Vollenhovia emeryi TaxID=411798 RepID=UPI0005F5592A|nr:PREDICTED: uncharacterized protein LOC105559123 [Vollenhovia emeryi]